MLIPEGGWGSSSTAPRPDWGGLRQAEATRQAAATNRPGDTSKWKPPPGLPAPPQMGTGTGIPAPQPINSVHDWLHRNDPEYQKPTPPATEEQKAAPPVLSEGLRSLLNDRNWELPTEANSNKSPEMKLEFEKGGVTPLQDFSYKISNEEWQRIQDTYSTPGALYNGYAPPADSNLNQQMPLMHLNDNESAALTWDQYDALSKDQRAAVDFNTLLVNAREKDLGQSSYLSPEAQTTYDEKVKKMFGEGGGSEQLAPNTVDLLSKLDMNFLGQDLDEYLSLDRGIDTTELGSFKFSDQDVKTIDQEINGTKPTYTEVRSPENLLAIDTAAIQKGQQMIKTALSNPEALTYDFNALMYGPSASQQLAGQPPLGFGDENTKWLNPQDAEKSGYFQTALGILGSSDLTSAGVPQGTDPMSWILGNMTKLSGYDKETEKQFLTYLQTQVDLYGQYGSEEDATRAAMISKRAGLGG